MVFLSDKKMLEDVCVKSYELYSYKPLTQRLSYGEVRAAINKAVTEGVAGGREALS